MVDALFETEPLVTVLIAAYDAGDLLVPALRSVVDQTYRNLDVLLVDDGSTDGSVERAVAAVADPRVRVLRHDNIGLAASLNRGVAEARGLLVARMDADDVSRPTRIAAQVAHLQQHPDVVLVGGQVERLLAGGITSGTTRFPLGHERIESGLTATEHVLCHPAVMFWREAARDVGGYWTHGPAEDWDFFLRMSGHGRLANIDEVVLQYRFHAGGINASSMRRVRRNMALAVLNHRRRGQGLAELCPADLADLSWAPLLLAVALQVWSLEWYRRGLQARGARRPALALARLGVASLLWPRQALRRVQGGAGAVRHRLADHRPVRRAPVPAGAALAGVLAGASADR